MRKPAESSPGARRVLVLGAMLVASSVAFGYYLQQPVSFWPVGNVEFQVGLVPDPPNVPTPSPTLTDGSTSWDTAFMVALNKWDAVLPDGVLTLSGVTGSAVTPAQGDGVNNVLFSTTIYGDTWGSNTLGICLSSFSGTKRTEADVLFNSTKAWDAYTGPLVPGKYDLRRVALHELGHAIDLDHPDDVGQEVDAIMNSTSSNLDDLADDDKLGALAVYGALTPVSITGLREVAVVGGGGNFAKFDVDATGSELLHFDWQRDSGGGFTSFGLDAPAFSSSGWSTGDNGTTIRVIVSNPAGARTSRTVTLVVAGSAAAPAVGSHPASVAVTEGEDVVLAVAVSGTPTPDVVWQMSTDSGANWGNVFSSFGPAHTRGATSPTLHIDHAITNIDGYQFRAVASSSAGPDATSNAATVNVAAGGPAPFFTYQPYDLAAATGSNLVFPAAVDGAAPLALQWEQSKNGGAWSDVGATVEGLAVTGRTTATLGIAGATTALNGYQFRLRASNGSGNETSRAVAPSIGAAAAVPAITDPLDFNAAPGATAAFVAAVVAYPAAVHQWQYSTDGVTYQDVFDGLFPDGSLVTGAQSRTLLLEGVTGAIDGTRFRLESTNAAGSATSGAATLNVGAAGSPPVITSALAAAGTTGEVFNYTIVATNSPTSYDATPLPDGLSVNSATGAITGTPSAAGTTNTTITATNADGSDSETLVITVSDPSAPAAPAIPVLSAPVYNGATAQWAAVSGATSYRLDVATDAAFTSFVAGYQDLDVGNVTSKDIAGLRLGTYYVRVRARNAGGTSASSSVAAIPVGSRLVNLSTRGVTTALDPLIAGFYISGQPKTVLIRVAAQALAAADASLASQVVPNPRLRLVDQASKADLAINDDWDASDPDVVAAVAASGAGLQFTAGSVDSVIVAKDLPAGGYTAIVETVTGASGMVLVELYEVDEVGRLVNISTRAQTVASGANVLIPGTFFEPGEKRLLIRVAGQRLQGLVPAPLLDPVLEVYDQDTPGAPPLATNDDWDSNDPALVNAWTQGHPDKVSDLDFAAGSTDSALIVVLPKNTFGYTAIARGKNGASGTVLVEVYELP